MGRGDLCLAADSQPTGLLSDTLLRYSPRHARDPQESTGAGDAIEHPRVRPGRHAAPAEPLTGAEVRVFRLMPRSLSRREIADVLFLSPNTVKTHTQAIYRKLGVSTRADAIIRGQQIGIL